MFVTHAHTHTKCTCNGTRSNVNCCEFKPNSVKFRPKMEFTNHCNAVCVAHSSVSNYSRSPAAMATKYTQLNPLNA